MVVRHLSLEVAGTGAYEDEADSLPEELSREKIQQGEGTGRTWAQEGRRWLVGGQRWGGGSVWKSLLKEVTFGVGLEGRRVSVERMAEKNGAAGGEGLTGKGYNFLGSAVRIRVSSLLTPLRAALHSTPQHLSSASSCCF